MDIIEKILIGIVATFITILFATIVSLSLIWPIIIMCITGNQLWFIGLIFSGPLTFMIIWVIFD